MSCLLADLSFGAGQNGVAALRDGWARPEPSWVWSVGNASALVFPAPRECDDVTLELQLGVLVLPPRHRVQRLTITVNGHELAQLHLGGAGNLRFELPPDTLRGQCDVQIAFRHPDAVAPSVLGTGQDQRQLAIRLFRLMLLQDDVRVALPAQAGPLMLAREWQFGWNEAATPMLLQGWGSPENGCVWADGRQSVLRVMPPNPNAASTIILDLEPFTAMPALRRQRVGISVAGQNLQYITLTHRAPIALDLPRPAGKTEPVDIAFNNFDAGPPQDGDARALAFRLRNALLLQPRLVPSQGERTAPPQTPATPHDIVGRFESLGTFCDFGLLQRSLGQEPPGLLRFAGIMTPELVYGIVHGFPHLGRPDTIEFGPRDDDLPGYGIKDHHSTISFRTPPFPDSDTQAAMKRRLAQRLGLLRRKFFEDAVDANKIFLFYREDKTTRAEVDAVLAALSIWGEATLLWLFTDPTQPPGSVIRLAPRLLCGFLPRSGPKTPLPDDVLLTVLTNAFRIQA